MCFVLAIIVLSLVASFLLFRRKHVRFSLYDDRIVRADLSRSSSSTAMPLSETPL